MIGTNFVKDGAQVRRPGTVSTHFVTDNETKSFIHRSCGPVDAGYVQSGRALLIDSDGLQGLVGECNAEPLPAASRIDADLFEPCQLRLAFQSAVAKNP